MKKLIKWKLLGAIIAAPLSIAAQDSPKMGATCPELTFEHHLSGPAPRLKNQVLFIDFWATWCGPCLASMPHVEKLQKTFEGEPVQFLLVTGEDPEALASFLKANPLPGSVVCDTDRSVHDFFKVSGIPWGAIVGKDGKIAFVGDPRAIHEEDIRAVLEGKPIGAKTMQASQSSSPPAGGPVATTRFFPGFDPAFTPFIDNGTVPKKLYYQTIVRPTFVSADQAPFGGMGTVGSKNGVGITWFAMPLPSLLADLTGFPKTRIAWAESLSETMAQRFDCILSRPFSSGDPSSELRELKSELLAILKRQESLKLTREKIDRPALVVSNREAKLTPLAQLRKEGVSLASYEAVAALLRKIETNELAVVAENFDSGLMISFYGFPWKGSTDDQLAWLRKTGFRVEKETRQLEIISVTKNQH